MTCQSSGFPNNLCQIYPSNLACSEYVGNQLVYTAGKGLYNAEITIAFSYLNVMVASPACTALTMSMICYYMFPRCLPWQHPNEHRDLNQRICAESCRYFHDDICKDKLTRLQQSLSNGAAQVKGPLRDTLVDIVLDNCYNSMKFPSKSTNPVPECLYMSVMNGKFLDILDFVYIC